MAEDMGSTVPRRQLGRTLRDLRTEAGITLRCRRRGVGVQPTEGVADRERPRLRARAVDVRAMCELYAATPRADRRAHGLGRRDQGQGLVARLRRWPSPTGSSCTSAWNPPPQDFATTTSSLMPGIFQTAGLRPGRLPDDQPRHDRRRAANSVVDGPPTTPGAADPPPAQGTRGSHGRPVARRCCFARVGSTSGHG